MRKNRGYKRPGGQHRDARLFAIVCEGADRERRYFEMLAGNGTRRLKVRVISPTEGDKNSAPKWAINTSKVYQLVDELFAMVR